MDLTTKTKLYRGTEYYVHIELQNNAIKLEPTANHVHCETTGKFWVYGYLIKKDTQVWKNSICNEVGRLSQGWKAHAETDTIDFILHKDKPKDVKSTYVRAVCDTRPHKSETHRTRLTV